MASRKRTVVDDATTRKTQRLNVQVDADAYERLFIHCIKSKKNPGEMITELINANLRQWRVQANSSPGVVDRDRRESDDSGSESVAA